MRFFLKPLLRPVVAIGCRTEEDRRRWIAIGAPPDACHAWGNTKYALDGTEAISGSADPRAAFVLVAGSVRPGEEALLEVLSSFEPGRLRLVVVPRHLREMGDWEEACFRRGHRLPSPQSGRDRSRRAPRSAACVLRERGDELPSALLVDRIGVLRVLYAAADAAFVGGTWIPLGGHNLFEPAREGVPVFFGPSISGVRDAADAIETCDGGACVDGPVQLAAEIRDLMGNAERLRSQGRGGPTCCGIAGRRGGPDRCGVARGGSPAAGGRMNARIRSWLERAWAAPRSSAAGSRLLDLASAPLRVGRLLSSPRGAARPDPRGVRRLDLVGRRRQDAAHRRTGAPGGCGRGTSRPSCCAVTGARSARGTRARGSAAGENAARRFGDEACMHARRNGVRVYVSPDRFLGVRCRRGRRGRGSPSSTMGCSTDGWQGTSKSSPFRPAARWRTGDCFPAGRCASDRRRSGGPTSWCSLTRIARLSPRERSLSSGS